MDRRNFISVMGLGLCAAGCAKTFRGRVANPPRHVGGDGYVGKVEDFPDDSSTLFYSKVGPVLVIKTQGKFYAYESICPHTMCELNDGEARQPLVKGELRCWIHDSYFEPESGKYRSGPADPRRPLPPVPLELRENRIYLKIGAKETV